MSGLVLILDGTPEGLELAEDLRAAGHAVVHGAAGPGDGEGDALAAAHAPALVVLDADAPGALPLCTRLRERARGRSLPILLVGQAGVTLHSTADAIVRGGDAFFARPVDRARMTLKILTLLGDAPPITSPAPAPAALVAAELPDLDEPAHPAPSPEPELPPSHSSPSSPSSEPAQPSPSSQPREAPAMALSADVGSVPLAPERGEGRGEGPTDAPDGPDGPSFRLHGEVARAGGLGDTDLPQLLAAAWAGRVTGRLRLRRGDADKVLHLQEGQVVLAASNLVEDRLVEILGREGRIPRAAFEQVRESIADSGRRAGAILVERGVLRHEELFDLVRRHFEAIVWSVFGWEAGEWSLQPGAPASGEQIRIDLATPALVLEGVRRTFSAARLAGRLGGPTAVLRARAVGLCAIAELGLSPDEERARAACDGARPVGAIAPPGAELDLTAALYALLVFGLVELASGPHDDVSDDGSHEELAALQRAEADRAQLVERARAARTGDYYAVLGLERGATGYEIRRAYLELRRGQRPHKDAPWPEDLRLVVAELDEMVDEAYEILRDPVLRSSYLAHLP